jgi:hypothetical protein
MMRRMISTEERAIAVASVLADGERAEEILARLGGGMVRAERCLAEARRRLALPMEERRAEAREVVRDLPAGLALVHPSWIEAALAGEGEVTRREVRGGSSPSSPGTRWLRRRLLGHLVAMPTEDPSSAPSRASQLPLMESSRLEAALERIGRARLALALTPAGPEAVAALAARLGPPHGRALIEDARRSAPRATVRQALEELSDLIAGDASLLLFRAGARTIAPVLRAEAGDLARQVAQRLPRPRGLVLLAEVFTAEAGGDLHDRLAMVLDSS